MTENTKLKKYTWGRQRKYGVKKVE